MSGVNGPVLFAEIPLRGDWQTSIEERFKGCEKWYAVLRVADDPKAVRIEVKFKGESLELKQRSNGNGALMMMQPNAFGAVAIMAIGHLFGCSVYQTGDSEIKLNVIDPKLPCMGELEDGAVGEVFDAAAKLKLVLPRLVAVAGKAKNLFAI